MTLRDWRLRKRLEEIRCEIGQMMDKRDGTSVNWQIWHDLVRANESLRCAVIKMPREEGGE